MAKNTIIAIVDDDPSVRDALSGLVRSLDFTAETFDSAEAFLETADFSRLSHVISDLQMPKMSGLDLQDKLIETGIKVPVIIITAFPEAHLRERAEASGVAGFLSKPFATDELIRLLMSTARP